MCILIVHLTLFKMTLRWSRVRLKKLKQGYLGTTQNSISAAVYSIKIGYVLKLHRFLSSLPVSIVRLCRCDQCCR